MNRQEYGAVIADISHRTIFAEGLEAKFAEGVEYDWQKRLFDEKQDAVDFSALSDRDALILRLTSDLADARTPRIGVLGGHHRYQNPSTPLTKEFGLRAPTLRSIGSASETVQAGSSAAPSELPLQGHFVPSDRLLSLWIFALNAISQEVSDGDQNELFDLERDRRELQKQFYRRFRSALSRYALAESYRRKSYRISMSHKFIYSFESAVNAEFLIAPSDGTPFFQMLSHELRNWLATGRKIDGSWGELTIDASGDFLLSLTRRIKVSSAKFKAAKFTRYDSSL